MASGAAPPLTPNSGLASWLTAARFFVFVDWRPVGQLLNDQGLTADLPSLTTTGTPANTALLTFLQAACGKFEAALLAGNRYQSADIAGLPANSNAAAFRDELLSKVAQQVIFRRRPALLKEYELINKEVNETLKALHDGEEIFPFVQTQDAGIMQATKDTWRDVECRDLTAVIANRYFGRRGNQIDGTNGPGIYGGNAW